MKKLFKAYGLAILALILYTYVELPVLRLDFISFYVVLVGFLLIVGISSMTSNNLIELNKTSKIHFALSALLIAFVIIVPFITSTPILHAEKYHQLIGPVAESDFSKDITPVSVDDIRLVDYDMAIRLGDKKIGEIPGLGSVAKLGTFHIQNVNDELFWVAPLVHRDFIKWVTHLNGTPGYIMVSATNPQDVRFIKENNGQPIRIIYQPDAFFHQDLARHTYLNGNMTTGLTDFTFEIDDEGQPYWVVTQFEHAIGFSGKNATGVTTVHATTGEVATYAIDNAPDWIDRIQPENFITEQLYSWGNYVDGFLNSRLAQANVIVPTAGMSLVYGDDGQSYWYTGMTSAGADESTVGFVLVNTRTKETKLYRQPGATEVAAMSSATGKVQEKGYTATFPVMYNILGTPTYVMSLKDRAGLIKMVAFVSVEDYSLVGVGDTSEDALRNYKEVLKSKGNTISIGGTTSETQTITGTIERIQADVQNGHTYYYFTLDNEPSLVFIVTSSLSSEIPLTMVGDEVTLQYEQYDIMSNDVLNFDNKNLNIKQ